MVQGEVLRLSTVRTPCCFNSSKSAFVLGCEPTQIPGETSATAKGRFRAQPVHPRTTARARKLAALVITTLLICTTYKYRRRFGMFQLIYSHPEENNS